MKEWLEQDAEELQARWEGLCKENTELHKRNGELCDLRDHLVENSNEWEYQYKALRAAQGTPNGNKKDSATQTDAVTLDLTNEVDNALITRPFQVALWNIVLQSLIHIN